MINLKINGIPVEAPDGSTILDAARLAGIQIPTLCYLREINAIGACRICVVEATGARGLVTACVYPAADGMEVQTATPKVLKARKNTLQLILSNHDKRCLSCVRSGECELQALSKEMGVEDDNYFRGESITYPIDRSAPHMYRDNNKCILCRRCVAACAQNQAVGVIGANDRGFKTHIGSAFDDMLESTACVNCGQCIVVCPTGALSERDDTDRVLEAISDPKKFVIVNTAPSVRATLGECFDLPVGTNVQGKMVAALRRLGFDKVFDTDVSADLTIMEEANELVERVTKGGVLPMITSCSPGWVKYCETYFPEFIPNLSSCKSPQQMFGALAKTWYAKKEGIDPKDMVVVSVMPCTAKKFEAGRDHQNASGYPDIDISITTRELGRMIKKAGIQFRDLPDEPFDGPLGMASGAGHIFGATGGVMEAALRTAVEAITGETLGKVEFNEVRGTEGIKEASYKVGDLDVKVAVCSGLANAKALLERIKSGEAPAYQFIEIMACPGGCVNGGGQPTQPGYVRNNVDLKKLRASALYNQDNESRYRKSHDTPAMKTVYEDFLEHPGSHIAHEVLHTKYKDRPLYK